MKKLFIIANWKSNKNVADAKNWLYQIESRIKNQELRTENKEIIVCPSYTLLPEMYTYIGKNKLPIKLGAQDISPFDEGAFTGAISGRQIKEFADYTLIGHSERRREFKEDDEILTKKVKMAKKYQLTPIYCVLDEHTFIPEGVTLVAYELASAIGTGTPDTPESAEKIAKLVRKKYPFIRYTLYGASVTPENVNSFTKLDTIDGALIGGASLDPKKFTEIIKNA